MQVAGVAGDSFVYWLSHASPSELIIQKYCSDSRRAPRCYSIQYNDLLALLCGVKKVLYAPIVRQHLPAFKILCAELHLQVEVLCEIKNMCGETSTDLLIGWDKRKLAAGRKAYKDILSYEWGVALGYSECCVKSYILWKKQPRLDLVRHILANSGKGALFDFRLNNVFNYFSRLNNPFSRPEARTGAARDFGDLLRMKAFSLRNKSVDCEAILPWHPCSYDCRGSAKHGRILFSFMERYMPRTAANRRRILSRSILFRDKFDYAALAGGCEVEKGIFTVRYDGIAAPLAFIGKAQKELLRSHEILRCGSEKPSVFPSGEQLPADYLLLPFAG